MANLKRRYMLVLSRAASPNDPEVEEIVNGAGRADYVRAVNMARSYAQARRWVSVYMVTAKTGQRVRVVSFYNGQRQIGV